MEWRVFLVTATNYFEKGGENCSGVRSWCSWTTFTRLGDDAGYWTGPLPLEAELLETFVVDGGTWGQPFRYDDLAHVIIPRHFIAERTAVDAYLAVTREQDIEGLSRALSLRDISHRISDLILEVKLY